MEIRSTSFLIKMLILWENDLPKEKPNTLPFGHNWLMDIHQKGFIYDRLMHLFSEVC